MSKEDYRNEFLESIRKSADEMKLSDEFRDEYLKTAIYFYDLGVKDSEKSRRFDPESAYLIVMITLIIVVLIIKLFV